MTHDELLAKISDENYFRCLYALKAVVELARKPSKPKPNTVYLLGYETAMEQIIQAIEKELG